MSSRERDQTKNKKSSSSKRTGTFIQEQPGANNHNRALCWPFRLPRSVVPTKDNVIFSALSKQATKVESDWDDMDVNQFSPAVWTTPSSSDGVNHPTTSSDETLDTETFWLGQLYPSKRNGTPLSQALTDPKSVASEFVENVKALNIATLKAKLQDVADDAAQRVSDRVNQACEGYDVPEIGYRVTKVFTSLNMPDIPHLLEGTADAVCDAAQTLLPTSRSSDDSETTDFQGNQFAFGYHMAARARRALVKSGICEQYRVGSGAPWYYQLNCALANLFVEHREEYAAQTLFEMKPVWKGDAEKKMWRLMLDTGIVDLSEWNEKDPVEEGTVLLDCGFELPERAARVRVADLERSAKEGKDEWLEVE